MNRLILKIFDFIKNCIHFFKILVLFSIAMLLLYWIQNLTGSIWGWTVFMNPLLDLFIDLGDYIYSGAISIFSAVFEYKYAIAILLMLSLYFFADLVYKIVCYVEELYDETKKTIQKIKTDCNNKTTEAQLKKEQKKIKRYQIYVSTSLKSNRDRGEKVSFEEQNKIMLDYLVSKTNIVPEKYGEGYLFNFANFDEIDNILDIFRKLIESKAPLNFIICVQIVGSDLKREIKELNLLTKLKILNKITTFSDTAFRYSYNDIKKYELFLIGDYQSEGNVFELHEFVLKDECI